MMRNLVSMIWIEITKAGRSRIPLLTAILILLMPLADCFMMVIFKDPEFAKRVGLVSTKANLVGGAADWFTYLSVLSQAIAVGGIFMFSLVLSWVFGREFVDGTAKDLFAVPIDQAAILLAKFIVSVIWCLALTALVLLVALPLAGMLALPGGTETTILQGGTRLFVTSLLVVASIAPVALFASVGRGYLLPLGLVFVVIVLAQLMAVIGYGEFFPWTIPGMYAGFTEGETLEPISYWIVVITGLLGILGTHLWWRMADQR